MIEVCIAPIVRVVTVGTLAGKVAARRRMTTLAIGKATVIKTGVAPVSRVVTIGTLTREVATRR